MSAQSPPPDAFGLERQSPSAALPMVLIGRPGLDRDCFCYVLRTWGVRVEFLDIAQNPNVSAVDAAIALVQVEQGTPWREWIVYLKQHAPDLALGVLLISAAGDLELELLELGVNCILVGGLTAEIAVAALQLARVGGLFVPPEVIRSAYRRCVGREEQPEAVAAQKAEASTLLCLTRREREIIHLLRRGLQNKLIAHELAISESTVKVHLRNIMKKLHATNRTQVAFLLEEVRKAAV